MGTTLSTFAFRATQVLFLVGVQMTSATTASIVNLTLPVFAAVLAILLGMEAFNWTTAIGTSVVDGATCPGQAIELWRETDRVAIRSGAATHC